MSNRFVLPFIVTLGAALLGGCASETGFLQTGALATAAPGATAQPAMAQPKIDPSCVTLASQIDTLRKDGVAERIEKASIGKKSTVVVKRESLAKITELAKADAEFQAKCSTLSPKPAQAQAQTPVTQVPPTAASTAPAAKATAQAATAVAPAIQQVAKP